MFTSRKKQIVDKLVNEASQVQDHSFKHKVVAAIVYKNKIVSLASNIKKTHTFQNKFSKNEHAIYFHAETFAIHKAIKRIGASKIKDCELFIVRMTNTMSKHGTKIISQELGNSHPCSGCMECITTFGIKKVIHSIDNGFNALSF